MLDRELAPTRIPPTRRQWDCPGATPIGMVVISRVVYFLFIVSPRVAQTSTDASSKMLAVGSEFVESIAMESGHSKIKARRAFNTGDPPMPSIEFESINTDIGFVD